MRVVSQILVALALTSCMVQISQALPTANDNMVMKRDGLPLVGDLLGGGLGGASSPATNAYVKPAGHGKKNKMGNKVHHKVGSKKQNKFKKVKKVKKVKHAAADKNMTLE